MIETLFTACVPGVIMACLGYWLGGKRKSSAESSTIEQQNVQIIMDTYQKALDDINRRLGECIGREKAYLEKIQAQGRKIRELENRLDKMVSKSCWNATCDKRVYPPVED
jgi:hypothetical protein